MEVSIERIERMLDAFSLLSVGEYATALARVEATQTDDRFAMLELALAAFINDLADARRANEAHIGEIERKLETIERQQQAINELSTPVIELWDEILTLPLVGVIDAQRALTITERLLQRIADSGARFVLIDVTGIETFDTMTANYFVQLIRTAQLLGAHCVLTGMSPDIARTLVDIGVELDGARTLRSLKEGLVYCLRALHQRAGDS